MIPTLGPSWMDPNWLLERFGQEMFWVSNAIIFIECGLFFPFLPGDTLLFSIGMFINRAEAGQAGIDFPLIPALLILIVAAFAGNVCGYEIGRAMGPGLYNHTGRFLKRKWLDQTQVFFDKYGNKALILGRFVPIVRTFVTLTAGVGRMDRRRFYTWSALGAVLWVVLVTMLGYLLGSIEFLQKNIESALLLLVVISVVPMVIEWWRHRRNSAAEAVAEPASTD